MTLTREWKIWLLGAGNTVVGGAVASLVDILTSPTGEPLHWKVILSLLAWNYRSYVKQHPMPSLLSETETVTTTKETTVTPTSVVQTETKETVTGTVESPKP